MDRIAPPINLTAFAGEHLLYEAQMFRNARDASSPISQFVANTRIEVYALHLRNLIDFFYPSHPRPDDVIAADYASGWDTERPQLSPLLAKARERAHKELAHLTTKRIAGTPFEKAWDFQGLSRELEAVIARFLPLLGPGTLPPAAIAELRKI